MNFLAHLYLSEPQPLKTLGNMMGDFVKGSDLTHLPMSMREGVTLHRKIDSFTDSHPVTERARNRLDPPYRRFAGIVVDMIFDHFLARQWPAHSDWELADLAGEVDKLLHYNVQNLPGSRRLVQYMSDRNLLVNYQQMSEIERSLYGISHRLRKANPLANTGMILEQHQVEWESDFEQFFPELVEFVNQQNVSVAPWRKQ